MNSLSQHRGNTQRGHSSRSNETLIYLPGSARPIGRVNGHVFLKTIQGSEHLLRRPPAIAFDISTIDDAEAAGATQVVVLDSETGISFRTSMEVLRAKSFRLDRRYGQQIALPLTYWETASGAASTARRPSTPLVPTTSVASPGLQMSLFGEN